MCLVDMSKRFHNPFASLRDFIAINCHLPTPRSSLHDLPFGKMFEGGETTFAEGKPFFREAKGLYFVWSRPPQKNMEGPPQRNNTSRFPRLFGVKIKETLNRLLHLGGRSIELFAGVECYEVVRHRKGF
ncbi:hypothetical protein RRG08_000230 [Elysia crispata]|uniref:Uncharacterized protein n=1 Tax=Elysia crispata TaxID=231223 RepID=A0AAE1AYT6_9GAST|nr:hypothetical protein RRG08_000230 [Elysia crispata]